MVLGRDAKADAMSVAVGPDRGIHWHALSVDAALSAAGTDRSGLTDTEAEARLARYGPNRLSPAPPASALAILRDQLTGVVVLLLLAAAVLSLLLGDRLEAVAIAAVLIINTLIGFLTEWRARRAMEALLDLDVPRATVVRQGQLRLIDASTLVPGDVIEVTAGHRVPADARLVSTIDLRVSEAALTGESLPISKRADVQFEEARPLAERRNLVFKSTTVAAGTGRAVVVATGSQTEVGRIGTLVSSVQEERTPLERRLDALGRRLVWLALGVAAAVATLGAVQGAPLGLVIETGIALAVAAVPEALPAVATIALAVGMRRMARRHALVRRLPAVETLGSTTVVCTDKTRTLTSGEMTIVRVWAAGREFDLLADPVGADAQLTSVLRTAALASRQQASAGSEVSAPGKGGAAGPLVDPVDAAVLHAIGRIGLDPAHLDDGSSVVGVVPFSSERKLMASFHERDGRLTAFVKGAPRRVLEKLPSDLASRAPCCARRGQRRVRRARPARAGRGDGRSRRAFRGGAARPDVCGLPGTGRSARRGGQGNDRAAAVCRPAHADAHRRSTADG